MGGYCEDDDRTNCRELQIQMALAFEAQSLVDPMEHRRRLASPLYHQVNNLQTV
jgi:hypothetical protein